MSIPSDIQIAQSAKPLKITEIAKKIQIADEYIEQYGKYKAKIDNNYLKILNNKNGKLILVTAINPTPAGEGKTTTTIGIADAFTRIGKKCVVALREPSLGPVFGVKGGATGGGYAQVLPMEDINLHFNGDFHAIGAANNLLAAMIDNHIHQGNELGIDPQKITWKRCVDMNDRQLRVVNDGLGGKVNGTPRMDGFDITVASEIMAIFCLADDIVDLKNRLSKIIIGYTFDDKPVTAEQLNAVGAMAALLKDALKPNLVQTLEGTPALIHGGPFANIAHGCNSVIATKMALKMSDYTITEAGFGADLGAQKFFDIKCRSANLKPDAVVLVATIRALKMHGGVLKENLAEENLSAIKAGFGNLLRHYKNITEVYNLPCIVAINHFPTDTDAEVEFLFNECKENGIAVEHSKVWANGGAGGIALAEKLVEICQKENNFTFSYPLNLSIKEKIEQIVTKVYRGARAEFAPEALKEIEYLKNIGLDNLPICMAKTQYSFSDDPKKLGAPLDFCITIKKVKASAGAGFLVALTGDIMTMPGLPKKPAAEIINVDENGKITGLF